MIVKIAAWLYIINAALTLSSLTFNPFGMMGASSSNLAVLMMGGLSGAMGVGLLKQKSWARWLSLGASFLGWTLGALLLLVIFGYLLFSVGLGKAFGFLFAGGFVSLLAAFVFFLLLVWAVGVVINFKLFFYLCSEDGCEEFDVPYGSAGTVAASAAAWIGIVIVNGMMTAGGSLSAFGGGPVAARDMEDDRDRERREMEQRFEQREREQRMQREEARRLREAEDRARVAAMEASTTHSQSQSQLPLQPEDDQSEAPVYERPQRRRRSGRAEDQPHPEMPRCLWWHHLHTGILSGRDQTGRDARFRIMRLPAAPTRNSRSLFF
jgi:hypothetical protein